jgi:hypothetical protein
VAHSRGASSSSGRAPLLYEHNRYFADIALVLGDDDDSNNDRTKTSPKPPKPKKTQPQPAQPKSHPWQKRKPHSQRLRESERSVLQTLWLAYIKPFLDALTHPARNYRLAKIRGTLERSARREERRRREEVEERELVRLLGGCGCCECLGREWVFPSLLLFVCLFDASLIFIFLVFWRCEGWC